MADVLSETYFATAPEGASAPDSITTSRDAIWVEYGNTASSSAPPGSDGSSTIVQYGTDGSVQNTYTLGGVVDGLKLDPVTGQVWALQNQDGNSQLSFIDPYTGQLSSAALTYDSGYTYGTASTRGFDDVAFKGNQVFLSETNPANPGDPVVVQLVNGTAPSSTLETNSILRLGDTGTNLATGQTNQPLPVTDPDSLKLLPDGSLILTGEHDDAFTIIKDPGTPQQSAGFVQLSGTASPDDAVMPVSTSGTFYVAETGSNDVRAITVTGLNTSDIYASVGTNIDEIDPSSGSVTPLVTDLTGAHGLLFVPTATTDLIAGGGGSLDIGALLQSLDASLANLAAGGGSLDLAGIGGGGAASLADLGQAIGQGGSCWIKLGQG